MGFLVITLHSLALTLNMINSARTDNTAAPATAVVLQEQSFQHSLGLAGKFNSFRRRVDTAEVQCPQIDPFFSFGLVLQYKDHLMPVELVTNCLAPCLR